MIAILRCSRSYCSIFATSTRFPHKPCTSQRDKTTARKLLTGSAAGDGTNGPHSVSSLQMNNNRINDIPKRIILGSCSYQNGDLSYWDRIIEQRPDLIILMGDNVYAPKVTTRKITEPSTDSIETTKSTMSDAYKALGSNPSFIRAVNSKIPMIATLDDNDYNFRHYSKSNKMTSEQINHGLEMAKCDFLNFFRVDSATDARWIHGRGVYTSYDYYLYENGHIDMSCSTTTANNRMSSDVNGKVIWRLQIILLDVRRHKSSFALQDTYNPDNESCTGPYIPSHDTNRTMLGMHQWQWLEEQLRYDLLPASMDNNINKIPNLRILVSPIQVLTDGRHGWDCWNLFPRERERLLSLLLSSDIDSCYYTLQQQFIPTILLSGDRHVAGFYKHEFHNDTIRYTDTSKQNYSFLEVTSSSLTHSVPVGLLDHENDTKRVGNFVYGNNFGVVQLCDDNCTTADGTTGIDHCTISINCAKTGKQLNSTTVGF